MCRYRRYVFPFVEDRKVVSEDVEPVPEPAPSGNTRRPRKHVVHVLKNQSRDVIVLVLEIPRNVLGDAVEQYRYQAAQVAEDYAGEAGEGRAVRKEPHIQEGPPPAPVQVDKTVHDADSSEGIQSTSGWKVTLTNRARKQFW